MQENQEAILKEMFSSGMHLGYSVTSRHPKMKPYIYGLRNSVEIFDLEKTKSSLDAAKEFLRKLGKDKKTIIFVGTKKESKDASESAAKELGMPFVKERWIGGILTNLKQIKARVDYLNDLKKKRDSGELEKYTKKEKLQFERKIQKMEKYFGGLSETLKSYPFATIVIDPKHEAIAVDESRQIGVPVVALLNSDCDPSKIKYPVPANDNSLASVGFFLKEIVQAYKEGLATAASVSEEKKS